MRRAGVILAVCAAYVAVFAGQTFVTQRIFTSRFPGGNDFYPRWAGGCLRLWTGADPYSAQVTQEIQLGIYGRPALPDEDQVAYAYPIYTLLFTWPFCATHDFTLVQAALITALLHLLVLGAVMARKLTAWKPPAWLWGITLGWMVLVYPNARAVILGQLSVVVFILMIGALMAVRAGRDALAGLCLALATIKPQMVFLLIVWLLWWTAWRRRWALWTGFGASLGTLAVLGWIVQPNWIPEFLGQLQTYTTYTEFGSLIWILTTYALHTPGWVEAVLTLAVLAVTGWVWWGLRRSGEAGFWWGTSLTLVLTHFVAPRTATTHFAPLVLILFLIFARWQVDSPAASLWKIALTLALSFAGSWALFAASVSGRQESAWNYLPIPLLLAAYLWVRKDEWLRPAQFEATTA